ncbi:beta-lactamase family protein [Arthrobacter gandavensis]|uniref:serine hydrolase domain-containing protein n=1 Tax=Arthrobacter gandavensis TaxID=169960 RepID=UPI00188EB7CF|nr:serine hydrolase domain-containing protein [Arthrobacter gandavensis]MBF4995500.1 beta-lactamase family protein [Arthrobacter gandavensis]
MNTHENSQSWPAENVAAAVVSADGSVLGTAGDQQKCYPLASVTKLLTAYAFQVALEEEAVALDDPAGPEGSTVRHLLAHTGGYDFGDRTVRYEPGTRRLYSNAGFEVLGDHLEEATGIPFAEYLSEAVLVPLGMKDTALEGSPAAGAVSTAADLSRFAAELQSPRLISAESLSAAASVVFPGLSGVLPGFGRQKENDWGLGFEIRSGKSPHWTGSTNSPRTFGHFGQSGTFLWVDPDLKAAAVVLTDRDFGPWAAEAWPIYNDALVAELRGS